MKARKLFVLVFAVSLLAALGCGGGSSGSGGSSSPTIACTDGGAAAANAVTMTCGGATNATTEQINVVIGGPAAGTTSLMGLNFDVTYDPTKVTFVSATAPAGGPFSAGALLAATAFPLDPTPHVVVAIQQVFGDPPVVINPGQQVVLLNLSFATASGVTTFAPTPVSFDPSSSEGTPPSTALTFGGNLMLSY